MSTPKVSVLCITYNQKKYIKEALDSFLMQKTNFDFEVLINDDASTDGTTEILREYAKKHPRIIKLNVQKENLYSKGVRGMFAKFLIPRAKGKYLALCEGDDYWTDPNKLQIQVDFMEKRPDYTLCFHPVNVFFQNNEAAPYKNPKEKTNYTVKKLLEQNFIQTNSVMYRRRESYASLSVANIMPGDWYLHLYHAQFGKVGFINRVMSAYRRHPKGIWWDDHANRKRLVEEQGLFFLAMYNELLNIYGKNKEYEKIISKHVYDLFDELLRFSQGRNKELFEQIINKFPDQVRTFLLAQDCVMQERKQKINKLQRKVQQMDQEINLMKSSRFWKARNVAARLVGKEEI